MRKILTISAIVGLAMVVWGQVWTGFDNYPGGHLLMTYRVTIPNEGTYSYTLELTPKPGSDTYTVRTEISGDASLGDLQATPYLLFAWQPAVWFSDSWWLPFYLSVFMPGQPILPNQHYVLPGGFSFVTEGYVTIAGVKAIKGAFSSLQDPSQRVVLAISPDPAVPYPVLIREESLVDGTWEPKSELLLVDYEHESP